MSAWHQLDQPAVEVGTAELADQPVVTVAIVVERPERITLEVALTPEQARMVAEAIYRHAFKIGGKLN